MNRDAVTLIEQVDGYVHLLDRVSAGGRFDDAEGAPPHIDPTGRRRPGGAMPPLDLTA
jgi:hypothetical protein